MKCVLHSPLRLQSAMEQAEESFREEDEAENDKRKPKGSGTFKKITKQCIKGFFQSSSCLFKTNPLGIKIF